MKKLLVLIIGLIFFMCGPVYAGLINGSGISGGGTDCPSGTYTSWWNGLYTSDPDKLCYNSGSSNKDGVQTGGTLTTGSYVTTDRDQYVTWLITAGDIIDDDGPTTIWLEVLIDNANTGDTTLFEVTSGILTNNMVITHLFSSDRFEFNRNVNSINSFINDPAAPLVKNVTTTIGVTYQFGRATQDAAISLDGTTWYDDGLEGIGAFTPAPTDMRLGGTIDKSVVGSGFTITKAAVFSSWKGAKPW